MKKKEHKLSRREFLYISTVTTGGTVLVACGGGAPGTPQSRPTGAATQAAGVPTATVGPAATAARPEVFKEAPQLAEMVRAGKLPKVEERLPKNPMVLQPVERVGTYGGDWNTLLAGPADDSWLIRTIGYEFLLRWKPDTTQFSPNEVIPNVAESFEANQDGTEFTFKLREGTKWSDGKPFTADDIMFWYEDVLMNEELTPSLPLWLNPGGDNSLVVEKVGDYSVVFRFTKPNGLFLQWLATTRGSDPTNHPRHYLQQFHTKYNKNADQQAKQANLEGWSELFEQKAEWRENAERPTLHGWKLTAGIGEATQQLIAERNAYYWKVDTEGNQLPYLDRVAYSVVEDREVMVLKALNGEVDLQSRHINALRNKPVFFDNREKGNYRLFGTTPDDLNTTVLTLNLTHQNPTKRQVFQNRDFRIGLSHAINRQEIIDVVHVSQGEPFQAAPRPESQFYNEELAKQYTEYSVQKANEHLDKVLPKKDADGFRLGPDGKRFTFQVETHEGFFYPTVDTLELVQRHWRAVGIDMRVKAESRELWEERTEGNLHDASVGWSDGGLAVLLDPRSYFPFSVESKFAVAWAVWFEDGPDADGAMEPPPPAKKQMELYRQVQATADPQKQVQLMNQILDITREQFWGMGISLPIEGYGIVKNSFHNVPDKFVAAQRYPDPAPTNPAQYFTEEK